MKKIALGLSAVALFVVSVMQGCSSDSTPAEAADAGGTLEASATDKKAPPSSGDSSTDAGSTCSPADVASFKPTWKPPSGKSQMKCTPAQIKLFASCVYDHPGYDEDACKAFYDSPANEDCFKCGYTTSSSAKLGAIVETGPSVNVNYGGCIALVTGDESATGCGAKELARSQCKEAACNDENCPVPDGDNAAFEALSQCKTDAADGVCKSFEDAADACSGPLLGDGGTAALCNPQTNDFGKRAEIYLELFCGGLGTDGGTDAGTDATTTTDAASDAAKDAPAEGG